MSSPNDPIVIKSVEEARQIGEAEMASWKEAKAAIQFLSDRLDGRQRAFAYVPNPDEARWFRAQNRDELQWFYEASLPRMRAAARACGYALGVHGSMRRDLDIIASPWTAEHSDMDTLAREVQKAACGIYSDHYEWGRGDKPCGRLGTVFPIAHCEFERKTPSLGCVDFAVMPDTDRPSTEDLKG